MLLAATTLLPGILWGAGGTQPGCCPLLFLPRLWKALAPSPALLPPPHPQLWGNSSSLPGKAGASPPHVRGFPRHPQSCLPHARTLTQPRQGQPCQPWAGTNYHANSNLQLHLIFI